MYDRLSKDPAFSELDGRLVPGEGDRPLAFIVGEAPGAYESIKIRPFVGQSGMVQRELMASADLRTKDAYVPCDRDYLANCWLTNAIKFRPPRNRKPTDTEIMAARPYLIEEWLAVGGPPILVAVGGVALTCILGRPASILKHAGTQMRGRVELDLPGEIKLQRRLYLFPMLHPAYGLRNKEARPVIEQHWQQFGEWLWTK